MGASGASTTASAFSVAAPIVTVATTPQGVEALRHIWSKVAVANIDSDIDYLMTVVANADQVISPYVVHIRRIGLPDMLVAARLENLPVRVRLGYWTPFKITLRAIVVSFDGVLGAAGPDDEALAMAELRRLMDDGAADLILMRNVEARSTLHAMATAVSKVRLARYLRIDRRWGVPLPDTLDEFLASRSAKSRSTLRRKERLLREEFGDRLRLVKFDRIEDIDQLCRDMEAVSALTYQHGLGAGFSNSGMQRALVDHCLRNGSYRCWMLYADERPIAFWVGMIHNGTFFLGTPGFDPEYGRLSIGQHTMFHMIADLCADPTVQRIDYGRGDAQYKSEYGRVMGDATDVWIAARRVLPLLAVNALSITAAANQQGHRLVENLHLGQRLKALWRRRLTKRPAA